MYRESTTTSNLVGIASAMVPPRGGEILGSRSVHFYLYLFFILSFLATRTVHTREPISTHHSPKDVRKCPILASVFRTFDMFGVIFSENPTTSASRREILATM